MQLQAGDPMTPLGQPSPRGQPSLGTPQTAQQLMLQQLQQQHRLKQQQQQQSQNISVPVLQP